MKKNTKNRKYNTGKSKNSKLFKLVLGIIFALLILLLLDFSDFFVATHNFRKYCYVMPSKLTCIISYCLLCISIIIVFVIYDKICIKQIKINELFETNKRFIIFLSVLLLGANILCYSSYYYIDKSELNYNKTTLFFSQKKFSCVDVERINISIENAIVSPTGGTPFDNYFIICTVYTKSGKYILESENFCNYSDLFNYIINTKSDINIDKSNYDELCQYELGKPLLSEKEKNENIKYINKIFEIKNTE